MLENFSQIPKSIEQTFLKRKTADCVLEFGALLGLIAAIVGLIKALGGASLATSLTWVAISLLAWGIGKFQPRLLFPAWRGWMALALVLNMVVSPLVLFVLWSLVVTPTGVLLRVFGKRLLGGPFRDTDLESYYIERPEKENDFKLLRRQF